MPTEAKPDKQKESILALKNANTHLGQIFKQMQETEATVYSVESELRSIAGQVGKINVLSWHENKNQLRQLDILLNELAAKLNKVRQ